jgi:hypothetical protein
MPRKRNSRAIEREQQDKRMTMQDRGNESLASENGMEADRADRTRGAGARGDALAGDEGVDDPAMSAGHRDDMTETPLHGDRLRESSQRMQSQRSRRTNQRANDERFDEASEFSGRGGQKEGSRRESESRREGTGYTGSERSNTDDNSSENPLT